MFNFKFNSYQKWYFVTCDKLSKYLKFLLRHHSSTSEAAKPSSPEGAYTSHFRVSG